MQLIFQDYFKKFCVNKFGIIIILERNKNNLNYAFLIIEFLLTVIKYILVDYVEDIFVLLTLSTFYFTFNISYRMLFHNILTAYAISNKVSEKTISLSIFFLS